MGTHTFPYVCESCQGERGERMGSATLVYIGTEELHASPRGLANSPCLDARFSYAKKMGSIRALGLLVLTCCSTYSTPEASPVEGGAGVVTPPLVDASAVADSDGGAAGPLEASSDAMVGPFSVVGDPCQPTGATITITNSNNVELLGSIFRGAPCTNGKVSVIVPQGVRIGSATPSAPSLRIDLPAYDVNLQVLGEVIGAGGTGGSGGNGGSGGSPRMCGREGVQGGTALTIEPNTHAVTVVVGTMGLLAGGGGGGGGASGSNLAGGGGGGAGSVVGVGGAAATSLLKDDEVAFCGQDNGVRVGAVGKPGTFTAGGPSVVLSATCSTGAGGALGEAGKPSSCAGVSQGGKAGYSVRASSVPLLLVQADASNIKGPRPP